jgi:hypothetical protein
MRRAFLTELQHEMECLWVSARGGPEAELSEYLYHRGVFGQNFCR